MENSKSFSLLAFFALKLFKTCEVHKQHRNPPHFLAQCERERESSFIYIVRSFLRCSKQRCLFYPPFKLVFATKCVAHLVNRRKTLLFLCKCALHYYLKIFMFISINFTLKITASKNLCVWLCFGHIAFRFVPPLFILVQQSFIWYSNVHKRRVHHFIGI